MPTGFAQASEENLSSEKKGKQDVASGGFAGGDCCQRGGVAGGVGVGGSVRVAGVGEGAVVMVDTSPDPSRTTEDGIVSDMTVKECSACGNPETGAFHYWDEEGTAGCRPEPLVDEDLPD